MTAACTLCRCTAVAEVYGFPVCSYHVDHGEDHPPCPTCFDQHGQYRQTAEQLTTCTICGASVPPTFPRICAQCDREMAHTMICADTDPPHGYADCPDIGFDQHGLYLKH